MSIISVKNLLEAGVHFGHRASRWNPKMAPYIYGKRNLIHIINLRETVKGIIKAYHFLSKVTAEGHEILFVGTKRQAKKVVREEALQCKMHYVSERWLGGTLTNFETIRKRLARLEELERMEEDGSMEALSKKMMSSLRREKKKIQRNLDGIRNMSSLPSALVVVDPLKERIAVLEAIKLNIPTIALMDTDSDPHIIDIPIPCNDDAMRSIEVICSKLTEAICQGSAIWEEKKRIEQKKQEAAAKEKEDSPRDPRTGRRTDNKPRPSRSKDPRKKGGQRDPQRKREDRPERASEPTAKKEVKAETKDVKAEEAKSAKTSEEVKVVDTPAK